MDFLNKAYAQLLDLFRSMTVGARIVSGLLLVVVVLSVAYLFNHQVSGPDEFLMNGESFPAAQLPAMMAAFGKANLSSFQVDGNRIRVPHSQQSAYMGALADANALPKNFGGFLKEGSGEMNGLMPIGRQKEMMKIALEQELALIISSMRGIESASVLYDSEVDSGFNQKEVVTATVSVSRRATTLLSRTACKRSGKLWPARSVIFLRRMSWWPTWAPARFFPPPARALSEPDSTICMATTSACTNRIGKQKSAARWLIFPAST